ncbi:hypothetical protein A2881_04725 [Candidatus Peribacteria bacterium RIFCSPHIGHO2_01_FULL_55_13]|nr:MAG: hypothetical protein A2881_04725 [Candidatus Peribacteria bacterium RIFCSPHIGHO2_01_FULL_55_13]OGJ66807.1 MAG: hypothetical protein A3F36_00470 [Candidatus Peribacteria bacterium RIFCSPHIGHO2_12_FULL_55_11]
MNDRIDRIRAAEKADPLYGRSAAREIVEGGERTRNVRMRIKRLVESGDYSLEKIAQKIRPDLEKLGLITLTAENDPSTSDTVDTPPSDADAIEDGEAEEKETVARKEKPDPVIRSIKDLIRRVADVVCNPEKRKKASTKLRRDSVQKHADTIRKARNKKLEENGMFVWTEEHVTYFRKLLNDEKYFRPISKRTKTRRYNHTALCWAMNRKFNTVRFDEDATRNKLDVLNTQARKEDRKRRSENKEEEIGEEEKES